MAKRRHEEPPPGSSRNALLILGAGGIIIAGLLVWALTRTVEPAVPVADTSTPPAATAPLTTDFTSTAAPPAQPDPATVEVPRIAAEDLRGKVNRNEVTVVDVRDAAAFAQGHIPGAILIPFASVQSQMDAIPKGKPVVTYCT
ncbi:MAG TPA: rhodanese-like domain-containing protein [Thermoanaerobaculia bacterium]|nr:rhodanese-like domain-containing protein [Thermoanaerobaculia bacterium]